MRNPRSRATSRVKKKFMHWANHPRGASTISMLGCFNLIELYDISRFELITTILTILSSLARAEINPAGNVDATKQIDLFLVGLLKLIIQYFLHSIFNVIDYQMLN